MKKTKRTTEHRREIARAREQLREATRGRKAAAARGDHESWRKFTVAVDQAEAAHCRATGKPVRR